MKFAIYTADGSSLSWQKRLLDEEHEVLVYFDAPKDKGSNQQRHIGDGIVPKATNLMEWLIWGKGGIYLFDSSHFGELAEKLRRRGELVIGGGEFCDRLEEDREFGFSIARAVGIQLPSHKAFSSIPDALKQLRKLKGEHYFKTDRYLEASATTSGSPEHLHRHLSSYVMPTHGVRISGILQEKLEGFALSTARWWNGTAFVGPYEGTVERKKFLTGDLGPNTGCSFNYLWFYDSNEPLIAEALHFDKIELMFRRERAPVCMYDINALLSKENGEAYFLEWTPRMGYDAQPTDQLGITELGKFLEALVTGKDVERYFVRSAVYGSVRLTVPPYPAENIDLEHKDSGRGVPLTGLDGLWSKHFIGYGVAYDEMGYHVADPSGLVGLSGAIGSDPSLFDSCYAYIKEKP